MRDLQILAKGPEPGLYEAPEFCWSFIQFYNVNLKDHNKFIQFNSKTDKKDSKLYVHVLNRLKMVRPHTKQATTSSALNVPTYQASLQVF